MKVKPDKVFPPTNFETVDNRDRTCFHELHIIELDVERFCVERICNNCLCTLEKKSYTSLKELLLDIHSFVDGAIGKVYVVSEGAG